MDSQHKKTIAVLGAGSWGTALALLLADNGHCVLLWDHLADAIHQMQQQRCNHTYLPDYPFPNNLIPCLELDKALQAADLILITVPSFAFKEIVSRLPNTLPKLPAIIWGCKGLDPASNQLLHEVAINLLGSDAHLAVLSGPSFASEVAAKLPTAVCIASNSSALTQSLSQVFSNAYFRVYSSDDIIGVELGGTIKNVMAIATGISDGMGFGANARSALITRGLAEMMRLGLALGGKSATFMGLTGMGDLVLTCTDDQSRNRRFGKLIGQGIATQLAIEMIGQVVEGYKAARQVYLLAEQHQIDMPIVEQVYQVLYHQLAPQEAAQNLLTRAFKAE